MVELSARQIAGIDNEGVVERRDFPRYRRAECITVSGQGDIAAGIDRDRLDIVYRAESNVINGADYGYTTAVVGFRIHDSGQVGKWGHCFTSSKCPFATRHQFTSTASAGIFASTGRFRGSSRRNAEFGGTKHSRSVASYYPVTVNKTGFDYRNQPFNSGIAFLIE
jgi:hypothetical protein